MKQIVLRPYVNVELHDNGQPLRITVDWCETFDSVWDTELEEHTYHTTDEQDAVIGSLVLPEYLPLIVKGGFSICKHCERDVFLTDEGWADPNATGDDEIWRLTCDGNEAWPSEHEGVTA